MALDSKTPPQPQIFSAGGVVVNAHGEVIVVNQRHRSWSLPKGHIDPGEDAMQAARREIMEETGITALEFIRDLGHFGRYVNQLDEHGRPQFKDIHIFLFRTTEQELRPQDPENPEARWVPIAAVADLLSFPEDQAFFRSIASLLTNI